VTLNIQNILMIVFLGVETHRNYRSQREQFDIIFDETIKKVIVETKKSRNYREIFLTNKDIVSDDILVEMLTQIFFEGHGLSSFFSNDFLKENFRKTFIVKMILARQKKLEKKNNDRDK